MNTKLQSEIEAAKKELAKKPAIVPGERTVGTGNALVRMRKVREIFNLVYLFMLVALVVGSGYFLYRASMNPIDKFKALPQLASARIAIMASQFSTGATVYCWLALAAGIIILALSFFKSRRSIIALLITRIFLLAVWSLVAYWLFVSLTS